MWVGTSRRHPEAHRTSSLFCIEPRQQSLWRQAIRVAVGITCCLLASSLPSNVKRPEPAGEYQVKALFLYNFAKFVDWPVPNSAPAGEPFNICVVGDDPFGSELDQAVEDKTINGRPVSVRRVSKPPDVRTCQIAFIGSTEEKRVRKLIEELNSASVLTVGEAGDFTEWGGIVKFTLEGRKIRFEINIDAADQARLKISSQLLSLARTVIRKGRR